jgi:hypothetical protein
MRSDFSNGTFSFLISFLNPPNPFAASFSRFLGVFGGFFNPFWQSR